MTLDELRALRPGVPDDVLAAGLAAFDEEQGIDPAIARSDFSKQRDLGGLIGDDVARGGGEESPRRRRGRSIWDLPDIISSAEAAESAPPAKNTGFLSTIVEGVKGVGRAAAATFNLHQGDAEDLAAIGDDATRATSRRDSDLTALMEDIQVRKDRLGPDASWLDTGKELLAAAANNPRGAGLLLAEQLPNSAAALGAGWAGMQGGAAAGTAVAGPAGAVVGGLAGGVIGMFGANYALEGGNKAIEAAQAGPLTPEDMDRVKREGATKAGIITGVDVATMGLSSKIFGAAQRAVDAAGARVLAEAGIDASDRAAVTAAVKANPSLAGAVSEAEQLAYKASTTLGQRAARGGSALGLETVGEGLGEYVGEGVATGKWDKMEAMIEAFSSLGQSAGEAAFVSHKSPEVDFTQPDPAITNAPTVEGSIAAMNASIDDAGANLQALQAGILDLDQQRADSASLMDRVAEITPNTPLPTVDLTKMSASEIQDWTRNTPHDALIDQLLTADQSTVTRVVDTMSDRVSEMVLNDLGQRAQSLDPATLQQHAAGGSWISQWALQQQTQASTTNDIDAAYAQREQQQAKQKAYEEGQIATQAQDQNVEQAVLSQTGEAAPPAMATALESAKTGLSPIEQQRQAAAQQRQTMQQTRDANRTVASQLADNEAGYFSMARTVTPDQAASVEHVSDDQLPAEVKPTAAFVKVVSRLLGKKVQWVRGAQWDGMVQDANTIYLNADKAPTSKLAVFGHEFWHQVKMTHREVWGSVRQAVEPMFDDATKVAMFRDYNAMNADLAKLTDDQILEHLKNERNHEHLLEEFISDMGGNRFHEEEFWTDVFARLEQREGHAKATSLIQRFAKSMIDVINKLLTALKMQGQGDKFATDNALTAENLTKVRDALAKGLADYVEETRYGNEPAAAATESDEKFSRLPSRWPTSKKAEPSVDDNMLADLETLRQTPVQLEQAVNAIVEEPGMRTRARSLEGKLEAVLDKLTSNLLWLYDQVPAEIRERSKLWYDGANVIATNWAKQYDKSVAQTSGILAVLSPQKDWFMNVTMGERVLDILSSQMDHAFDGKMRASAFQFLLKDLQKPEDKRANTAAFEKVKKMTLKEAIATKDMLAIGIWLRAYDEAHHAAQHAVIHPEGDFGENATTVTGSETLRAWGGFDALGKAASIFVDGSPENINAKLGGEHKVRNFYNNIFNPKDENFATIDTHAVAADMLRPLAGADKAVADNFGGSGGSNLTGVSGTYPIHFEAYKRAAKERGVLPREMQSITWEAVRGLFTEGFKGKKDNLKAVDDIWRQVDAGKMTPDQAREKIVKMASGMEHPDWWDGKEPQLSGRGKSYDQQRPAFQGTKVTFEVAPDPHDKALTDRWNALPQEAKDQISYDLAWGTASKVLAHYNSDTIKGELHMQVGGYLEDTNPSFSLWMNKYASMVKIQEIAKSLGYVLKQDSMVVGSTKSFKGGSEMGVVVVRNVSDANAKKVYDELRAAILDEDGGALINGHTTAENDMSILVPLGTEMAVGERVAKQLDGRHDVYADTTFVQWPERGENEYGFSGTKEDIGAQSEPSLRGFLHRLRTTTEEELDRRIKDAEQGKFSARRSDGAGDGRAGGRPEGESGQALPEYGTGSPGAVSVVGRHYSVEERASLDGRYYGTGARGKEAERVRAASDPRIKERIYFYVEAGKGITPEQGVGSHAHDIRLNNLYDIDADTWLQKKLPRGLKGDEVENAFESAVLDNGFDGYVSDFGTQRAAVLLGRHSVKPAYAGVNPGKTEAAPAKERQANPLEGRRDLPMGKMTGAEWKQLMPEAKVEDDQLYYKDQLKFSAKRDRANIDTAVRRVSKFVDAYLGGQVKPEDTQIIGPTPVVLRLLGAQDLNMELDGAVLQKVLAGKHRRDITPEMLKQLPEGLYDPLMVFKQPEGGAILLTEMEAETGNPVVVATHFRVRSGRMLVNRVASMFEYDQLVARFSKNIRNLAYVRNEEDLAVSTKPGQLDLPDLVQKARGLGVNVANEEDLVNLYGARYSPQRRFYSQLERSVEQAPDKVFGSAKQVKLWLNANKAKLGIKDDEIQWTGINEWLDLQQGKVGKQDVLGYLAQNGVQVEDVEKGSAGFNEDNPTLPEDSDLKVLEATEEYHGRMSLRYKYVVIDEASDTTKGWGHTEEEAIADAHSGHPEYWDKAGATRYGDYVLPGGENYRELLLTLPARTNTEYEALKAEFVGIQDDALAEVRDLKPDEKARMDTLAARMADLKKAMPGNTRFHSAHWEEANILAHVRFNDRTDADGNKVLFIEELQSDWGQEGKKRGFDVTPKKALAPGEYDEVLGRMKAAAAEEITRRMDGKIDAEMAKGLVDSQPLRQVAEWAGMQEEWASIEERSLEDARNANRTATPAGPFVTKTEAWLDLGLKRMIAYAVENGYDKVAFVNGQQSADRYDLSKQVDVIYAGMSADGKYLIGADKGSNRDVIEKKVSKEELPDLVGKELAEKIINDVTDEGTNAEYRGLDLTVGGEGMKAFYDQIVPQRIREVLKKLGGGKTEIVAIDTPRRKKPGRDVVQQTGFSITPEMREKVGQGMPLFSPRRNIFGQTVAATWSNLEQNKADDIRYALQDKQIDTKRLIEKLQAAGRQIVDRWNPYLQEELYHGRSAKGVKDFIDAELTPLLKDMKARGVTLAELETYLHNRHAEERNLQIAKVNPNMPDEGSGIKTADARNYLRGLPPAQRNRLEALARKVDAINAQTLDLLEQSGLEKPETIRAMRAAYQYYVPLNRDIEGDGLFGMGVGQGYSVKGAASKRAMGSKLDVVDIMANVAMQRERAITRVEKNRVAQALYGLAIQNPNSDFWLPIDPGKMSNESVRMLMRLGMNPIDAEGIMREPVQRYINPQTGLVAERINPSLRNSANVLGVRINGEDKYVFFSETDHRAQRMVHSLKNLDADQLGLVMGAAAKGTRWFAAVNTQYNPIFGVINLLRDFQGALFNLSTTPIAGKQKDVMHYTVSALKGIYIDLRDHRAGVTPTSSWAQEWEEFQRNGGQTGYKDMFSRSAERTEALERDIKRISEGKLKHAGRAVFDWLSDYNETMENAVRLASYRVAKEQGISPEQAASIAKNLTVNFNRKGQVATQAGALYAFFNANIQGTSRLLETLKGPAGKKIITGGLLLGVMQAVMLAAAGYGDDEPPEFVRERSLIIPVGDHYVTIPMPLGLHLIPNIGRISTEFVLGGFKQPVKHLANMVNLFADSFNPIGNAGLSMQTLAPTVIDPLAALAENKDWTGKPIAQTEFNSLNPTPGYLRAKDTASELSKTLSYWLNIASGGTDYKKGLISPTPDQLDYLVGQVTGGVGREYLKGEQVVTSTVSGETLPLYKIPLVGRFVGETTGPGAEGGKFYAAVTRINEHEAEVKGLRSEGKFDEAAQYIKDNPEASLVSFANGVESQLRKLKSQKRDLVENGAPRERVKLLEDRITATMRRLNDRVGELSK